jgi:N-acetylglucosamine repressor
MSKQTMVRTTADHEFLKNFNLDKTLQLIKDKGPISRASIAKITGMSRSTSSLIVDHLIKSGLVVETGKDASTGGRKPILVRLNHEAGLAIGVKIEKEQVIAAIVDLRGEALSSLTEEVSAKGRPSSYLTALVSAIRRLVEKERTGENRRILGIGIGMSGLVDSEAGVSLDSSIINWKNMNLREALSGEFGLPIYVENDVNTFAIGEKWLGIGKDMENFLCVTIGRGIGVGAVIGGALYRGNHHGAGEFGHTKISDAADAPLCSCGRRGCIEAFASNPAILEHVRGRLRAGDPSALSSADPEHLTLEQVLQAAREGDGRALGAYARAGRYLGYGMANLINLFDPEAIIVSGEGTVAGIYILPEMEKAIAEHAVYGLDRNVKRIPLYFEDDMWVRGVATLVVREVFRIPV